MKLPNSRTENIVVQKANKELLIYDLVTNQAFCLNETLAIVFNASDGKRTLEELKGQTKLTDDIIFLSLDELKKNNLMADQYESPFTGMSRRKVIKKVGLASMIALPMVMTIVAPVAAQTASACLCPTTLPPNGAACQSRGEFTVGCVTSESACDVIINTTTACCNGVTSVAFLSDTQCCVLGCDPRQPGGG